MLRTRLCDLPFPAGIANRVLRNAFTSEWHAREEAVVDRRAELRALLQAAEAAADGTVGAVLAGSGAGLIDAVAPAGELVRRIAAEAERLLRERPSRVLR